MPDHLDSAPQGSSFPHPEDLSESLTFCEIWEQHGLTVEDIDAMLTGIGMSPESVHRYAFAHIHYAKALADIPEFARQIVDGLFMALHMVGVGSAKQNPMELKLHYHTHSGTQLFPTGTRRIQRPKTQQLAVSSPFDDSRSLMSYIEGKMHEKEFQEHLESRDASAAQIALFRNYLERPMQELFHDAPETFHLVIRVLRHFDFINEEPTQLLADMRGKVTDTLHNSRSSLPIDTQELGPDAREFLRSTQKNPPRSTEGDS